MPTYTVNINGRTHRVDGEAGDNLLSVLRHELGLDRHAAAVRRPLGAGAGVPHPRGTRPRHRPRLHHLKDERLRAVLQAAAKRAGWPKPSAAGHALGIACGTEKGSYVATAAELSKTPDGFRVERLAVAFECGAIVHPDGLSNQIEDCVVQGLGGAVAEAIEFREGIILNGSMQQYPVPRFGDTPPLDIVLLDRRDLPSAGAGETPIVCVAPAIGSAARMFGKVDTALPVRLV